MLLPHVFHLEVLCEALVCGFPNQNQVVNGHKLGTVRRYALYSVKQVKIEQLGY